MIVHLQKHYDCQTKNIIYLIKCKGAQNIGETQETLETRFSQHLGYVHRNEQDKATGKHFNLPGHSELNMSLISFEQVFPKEDTLLRKRRESYWINLYHSLEHGANSRS